MKNYLPWFGILAGLFIISYADTLNWMYGRYMGPDSYYSHGFFIPLVTGYLIWLKRDQLKDMPAETSIMGAALIGLAMAMHVFGTIVYIYFISGASMLVLVWGTCLFLYGPRITATILFPLLFLVFMIPVPLALINMVSFPLKMLVAKLGVEAVALTGIPVLREGFNITIPEGSLLVGNPCSGLRSLITFLAIGSLFAYTSNLSLPRRWILFLMAVPVAIFSNLIRVPLLVLWSHKWGIESAAADTPVHTGSGFLVFIVGMALLYGIYLLLREKS
jgi:exosortase A